MGVVCWCWVLCVGVGCWCWVLVLVLVLVLVWLLVWLLVLDPPDPPPAPDPLAPDLPAPDRPKFRFFFPPASIFALSVSLGVFSLNFGSVPQMCTFGVSLWVSSR